jgi:hypothetical protein
MYIYIYYKYVYTCVRLFMYGYIYMYIYIYIYIWIYTPLIQILRLYVIRAPNSMPMDYNRYYTFICPYCTLISVFLGPYYAYMYIIYRLLFPYLYIYLYRLYVIRAQNLMPIDCNGYLYKLVFSPQFIP